MLVIEEVVKAYGKLNAVDGVTLKLEPGVVGLVGHNGAGKTTLMQMLATLTRPTRGRLLLDGQDIVARPQAMRERLGYLPQDILGLEIPRMTLISGISAQDQAESALARLQQPAL